MCGRNESLESNITPKNLAWFETFIGWLFTWREGCKTWFLFLWKWMHSVLVMENLKPFSSTHFWIPLMHNCNWRSTPAKVLPLAETEVINKKWCINVRFNCFNYVVYFKIEKQRWQNVALWHSHFLRKRIWQSRTDADLKISISKKIWYKQGKISSKTKVFKV